MDEIILPIVTSCGILFALVFGVGFLAYKYDVNVGKANIVCVYDGDEKIYQGKRAFIGITSGGMTTSIAIYKSLYPFDVIDQTYSSNEIKITPCKGE